MEKKEEKEIEYLFAHMNRLWAGVMVLGGGLAGLSVTFDLNFTVTNIIKLVLFVVGFFLFSGMLAGLVNIKAEINKKIK